MKNVWERMEKARVLAERARLKASLYKMRKQASLRKQKGSPFEVTPEDVDAYDMERRATENELAEGNPPAWVASESKWEQAKKASRESFGEIRWPFVAWLYLNRLKGGTKSP